MTLVGMRITFVGMGSDKSESSQKIPQLWDSFLTRASELKNKVGETYYGVIRKLEKESDEMEYYCALEVSSLDQIPAGMTSVEVPSGTYAKFTHREGLKKLENTIHSVFSEWLP